MHQLYERIPQHVHSASKVHDVDVVASSKSACKRHPSHRYPWFTSLQISWWPTRPLHILGSPQGCSSLQITKILRLHSFCTSWCSFKNNTASNCSTGKMMTLLSIGAACVPGNVGIPKGHAERLLEQGKDHIAVHPPQQRDEL